VQGPAERAGRNWPALSRGLDAAPGTRPNFKTVEGSGTADSYYLNCDWHYNTAAGTKSAVPDPSTVLKFGPGSWCSVQPSGQCWPVAAGPFSGPLHLRRSNSGVMAAVQSGPNHSRRAIDVNAVRHRTLRHSGAPDSDTAARRPP